MALKTVTIAYNGLWEIVNNSRQVTIINNDSVNDLTILNGYNSDTFALPAGDSVTLEEHTYAIVSSAKSSGTHEFSLIIGLDY